MLLLFGTFINFFARDSVFAKSATVLCPPPNSHSEDGPGFFSSDLINLIHFIFYGSIQGERKARLPSLRTRVLLHLVSCINLAEGRWGTGRRREANWMPFDTEADESSARVFGDSSRPAGRRTPTRER